MLNNSGTYGPEEAPTNMVASINRPQSPSNNINYNLSNFTKIVQQSTSSVGGHYEPHNLSNFGQPPVGIPRAMHPFQAYQTMGHSSTFFPQNSPFTSENAIQDYFPAVSTTIRADHHKKMLNFHQNFLMNISNETPTASDKESSEMKGYPLNIPQIPTRILQKNYTTDDDYKDNDKNVPETSLILPESTSTLSNTGKSDLNDPENLSLSTKIQPEIKEEKEPIITDKVDSYSPKNLSGHQNLSSDNIQLSSPAMQNTSNMGKENSNDSKNDHQNKPMLLENSISERKRKSLEKTVRLIESILIKSTNNNTKSDISDDKSNDPLAFSPKPNTTTDKSDSKNDAKKSDYSDSDDEVLIKKVAPKGRRKLVKKTSPPKMIESTRRSHVIESETEVQFEQRMKHETENVTVKIEYTGLPDVDYGNPFHRDSNGMPRNAVGDGTIIDMENSVAAALDAIKNGTSSLTYYECPHCLLLLFHPKRFLVHTKWHSFGLLNDKRAEIAKEREDKIREKREARLMQRLMATEATGEEEENIHPCKDCDKAFTSRSGLKNHRRKCHATEVTECRICFVPVPGWKALQAHMTVHKDNEAGLHQCPNCPKRFKYRHSLSKHADTHLEKTHGCPECSKMFGSAQLVKLHMKTHERMARGTTYHCSFCGKGFYETYNLNVHERTHRNDKPYKCDICESRFVTNSSLKRHVRVSHCGAKPHTCDVCHKCFSTESIRDRHILRVHSDQEQFPHQCEICPKRYMKTKDLRNHIYKMHTKRKRTISKTEPVSSE